MLAKMMATGVFAAVAAHASAMCLATTPADVNDAYGYYVALTNALESAKTARDESMAAAAKGNSSQFSPVELVTALKNAQADYACGQQYVQAYRKSVNKGIALSAISVESALMLLNEQESRLEQYVTDRLNGKPMQEGANAQELSDINVQFDNAWQMLMVGVASSSQAAPHYNSSDRVDGITLSPQQRADVVKRLRAFGPAVQHKENNMPLEASVAILLEFFRNKQLKSFGD